MKSDRSALALSLVSIAMAGLALSPATAGVVFSESFEAPLVSGFASNTIPSGGKWIGATQGFGATTRGLYNETFSWPATAAFNTPYGGQAYYIAYSNSGLTTAVGATGQTLTADVTYKVAFNAAVTAGTASGSYQVELVAFAAADNNTARNEARGNRPGTILATAAGAVTTNDMSATGSLTFTPAAANAHLSKDLGIRLIKASNNVLYDNIRMIVGHDMLPSPASGSGVLAGNTVLSWTNMPPTLPATNTYVDVWFGTNPASLTQIVDGLITSTTNVNALVAGTYYWRVDSYLDGNPNGTPVTGDLFTFVVSDSDGDGLPDAYELANTTPPSATSLDPAVDYEPDGLTTALEYFYGTNPKIADTDGDTLLDGPELAGVDLRPATSPVKADTDNDGISDGVESNTGTWVSSSNSGTNPADADWDNDGIKDGAETNNGTYVDRFNTGSNPFLTDSDSDGAGDWYEANASLTNPNSSATKPNVPYPLPDPDGSLGATNKPVKVYIMAGQSNMVGIGSVNGAEPGTLETIAKRENKFPNLVNGSNNWTLRNDVIYKGVVTATAAGPLTAGQGAGSTQLGPELGFGQIMGWYHDEPVLLIKASQGNRSLGWDFLPPGSPQYVIGSKTYAGYGDTPASWTTGSTPTPVNWYAGKQYDDCFRNEATWPPAGSTQPPIFNAYDILANGVLQGLPTTGNNLNGRTYEIAGFVWWQGHKDHTDGVYAPRYEENLVKLINALRADFNAPNAPFVVASIGFGGGTVSTKPALYQAVHNAQMNVGDPSKYPLFAGTVKSVDTLPYWREVAESPTNQDYHYNKSAETYTLVGDAMGRAMLEMQNDTSPPSPTTMTFAIAPTPVNTSTVGMVATTAVDVSGPVEYYFENTSNSTNSDWITSTTWNNTGLTNGVSYDFRVKARDSKGNEGTWSAVASAAPGNDVTNPSPDPMSFAAPLTVLGENSIQMTATTATDINGVQYQFICTMGGGPSSGWQVSPEFTATGLSPGTSFTYVVRAKDSVGNTTSDSAPSSATTTAPDTTPPSPASMSFASPPTALGIDAISMTATTASDPSGVEYFFEETSGNPGATSSGWQNSAAYTDSGLQPGTQYTYRVRARDKSPAQTANNWSSGASATTEVPDITDPTAISFSPTNGASNFAVNASMAITFDEEITQGTGLITIKNLTDTTQFTIDITDSAQVSAAGAVLTINPTANLAYEKNYAIQIADTAIDDLVGNSYAGILNDTTWAFTTATPPPSGIVFADGFEAGVNTFGGTTPDATASYTLANTSAKSNTALWVRATSGFGSSQNGLIHENENGGVNFADPVGSQAYGFRYTNSGVTTALGKIGTLTSGTTITVTFDAVKDGYNTGLAYEAYLVLFDAAAARNSVENAVNTTAAILAKKTGSVTNNTSYQTFTFSYTVGDIVVDNNGATAGTATAFLPALLGKDIALRFKGATTCANIDNVQVAVTGSGGGNTPPTISNIANLSVPSGGNTGALAATVGDAETAAGSLTVTGTSSNTTLVPNANIVIGGSGANRTVTVTPVSGLVGSATITVTVNDGTTTANDTFLLTVTDNYLSWSTANGVTGGANGDSNNNGVKNLVEYALVNGGERGVYSGNTITFTKRGAPYGSELIYVIETSETLLGGSWTDAVTHAAGNPSATISLTFTPGSPVKKFARLRVVQSP